jgi:hypothetical protein
VACLCLQWLKIPHAAQPRHLIGWHGNSNAVVWLEERVRSSLTSLLGCVDVYMAGKLGIVAWNVDWVVRGGEVETTCDGVLGVEDSMSDTSLSSSKEKRRKIAKEYLY